LPQSTGAGVKTGESLAVDLGGGPALSGVEGVNGAGRAIKMEFVWIPALQMWVGKYEVTNAEYRKYRPKHDSGNYEGHSLNGDRQPVVLVNFDDAKEFAKWLTEQCRTGPLVRIPEDYQFRLPTEKEWLTFAQCGKARHFPWGSTWPPPTNWNYHGQEGVAPWGKISDHNDGFPVSCPVENSGRNDWDLYGVGGNVWEATTANNNSAKFGAWRGAAWDGVYDYYLCCSCRQAVAASSRVNIFGFRLVVARPVPAPGAKP
jgi:formylglycine-generating enzyme required for sulfatase activity